LDKFLHRMHGGGQLEVLGPTKSFWSDKPKS
jgi:hypothetical protein